MANKTYHPRGVLVDGYPVQEHPLYFTWSNMLRRCDNPSDPWYENYGGRGIKVCDRWHHFRHFAADMGMKPTPDHTLERSNNNLGYFPGNCVWATRTEQCLNRRTFRNNTSSVVGAAPVKNGRYCVRFDYEKVRYMIGRTDDIDVAAKMRSDFVELFFKDREAAIASISGETVWGTSTTKVRGITPHKDGGFVARCTINKERFYVGYYQTIEEAERERAKFIARKTRES